MPTLTQDRTHPKADPRCCECRGTGYVLRYLDLLDPAPSTTICRCVLRRLESDRAQGPLRHGRPA